MKTVLTPYLSFRNSAREAMEFYRSIFGGELVINTFKQYHVSQDPSEDDNVMHSMLDADGVYLMAADTPNSMEFREGVMNLSLSGTDQQQLTDYFNKLAQGGKIRQPLEKAAWGDTFGMLTDKFGVEWMINIFASKQ